MQDDGRGPKLRIQAAAHGEQGQVFRTLEMEQVIAPGRQECPLLQPPVRRERLDAPGLGGVRHRLLRASEQEPRLRPFGQVFAAFLRGRVGA